MPHQRRTISVRDSMAREDISVLACNRSYLHHDKIIVVHGVSACSTLLDPRR